MSNTINSQSWAHATSVATTGEVKQLSPVILPLNIVSKSQIDCEVQIDFCCFILACHRSLLLRCLIVALSLVATFKKIVASPALSIYVGARTTNVSKVQEKLSRFFS